MRRALDEARLAQLAGDVPVGAVIVRHGEIVSRGKNRRESGGGAAAHAEIEAISEACRALGGWRLWQCELFVTLEPCPMCAGAIINSRLRRVVYGAADAKAGCCGSVVDLFALPFNHRPQVESGLCEAEATALLTDLFRQLRQTRENRPKWRPPAADMQTGGTAPRRGLSASRPENGRK